MTKVLIAGATGYLGAFVAMEFKQQGYFTKVLARSRRRLEESRLSADDVVVAEITQKDSLAGCCKDMDVVFSSIGITKQKDGCSYMDVDYQANLNLLEEAKTSGVRKFIYVSVLHGDKLKHLKICEAKEKFVDALKESGIDYCIIRPTGYFSDMGEIYRMAEKGRVFLFGRGSCVMNPIHGEDLAKVCADAVRSTEREIPVGGPEIFSHEHIAETAFSVSGKRKKITHIPLWIKRLALGILRIVTGSSVYGPIEFFMTVLSIDMVARRYGTHTLGKYFEDLKTHRDVP